MLNLSRTTLLLLFMRVRRGSSFVTKALITSFVPNKGPDHIFRAKFRIDERPFEPDTSGFQFTHGASELL